MPEITPECLSKAADLIEAKGWGQRQYYGHQGSEKFNFCLLGAVAETCNFIGLIDRNDYENEAAQMLGFQDAAHAAEWNDDTCRTAAEVTARLRSLV